MLLNTESTYQSLQSFSSIEDMNYSIKYYKKQYKSQLTKSTYAVLDFISQYACKYVGVCYLSKSKIAGELNITRRTVQRACDQLEKLGIIVQYSTKRATGDRRQSTNAIVIQPLQKCHSKLSQQETPIQNSKSINTNDTEKIDSDTKRVNKESLIKEGLVNKLPKALQVLSYFFDVDDLYKLSGTIYKAKASVDKSIQIEEHDQEYYHSILSVITAYKRKKVRDVQACLFVAIRNLTKSIWLKQRAKVAFGL